MFVLLFMVLFYEFLKIGFMRPFDIYKSKIAPILCGLISQRWIGRNDGR